MSIQNTLLEKAVVMTTPDFQKFENRKPQPGIIKAFRDHTTSVVDEEEISKLKVSRRRPVEIAVMKKEPYTVGTVREINPIVNQAGSAKVPLNWFTKTFGFSVRAAINSDNYIKEVAEFRQSLFNGLLSVLYTDANSIEKNLAAYLATNKWAVPPATTVYGVNVGTGAYEIDSDQYIIKAPIVMQELDMMGRFQDIGNIGSIARRRDQATFGRNNSRDISQYLDDFDYYQSNAVTVTPGAEETHFLVPTGSLGLLNIVEWDARNRTEDKDGHFEVMKDPFFGFEWGVYITAKRTDQSAYGTGFERVVQYEYHFAADFAAINSYSSVAGQSPIMQFDTIAG